MPIEMIYSSIFIAGVSLIWKLARKNARLTKKIDSLPHFVRRQLVCSACFIYWISLIFSFLFSPLKGWIPRLNFSYLWGKSFIIPFLFQVVILGLLSVFIFHLVVFIIEYSHLQTERAVDRSRQSSIS
jgi:hypothetical protein